MIIMRCECAQFENDRFKERFCRENALTRFEIFKDFDEFNTFDDFHDLNRFERFNRCNRSNRADNTVMKIHCR